MQILGVHFSPPFLRITSLRKGRRRGGIEIRSLKSISLSEAPTPLEGFSHFKGKVASGIARDFLIRPLELKIASHRHVEETIAFQSEAMSHFASSDVLSVPLIQKKEKGEIEVLLFTVSRKTLQNHLSELAALQLDPDGVSIVPLALCHFIRWKFPELLDAFIVDLGSSETVCTLMEDGQLKKAHVIEGGVERLLSALLEDRKKILLKKEIEGAAKQIDLLLLKPGLNPNLTEQLEGLRQEVAKTFYSFCREAQREVIFTGRSDAFIHLREFLMEYSESQWPLTLEEQKFGISIGLALEQLSPKPLQLRREEFFPQKNWNRLGFYAFFLLTASIFLSAVLVGGGMQLSYLRKKEMLQALHLPKDGDIDQWIDSIEKNNREYPYISQAYNVTEVLSWLSSHPLLEELKKEGDPIDLREIRYQLVSFPKIGSPKEPYLAKVEIEFDFKSAMNARKFHEALRKGDDRVNPNLEIAWDALTEGYRVSFFLKNRSPYVF